MKNVFGSSVSITLFGESHGECIGAVIDGVAPGILIDEEYIREKMNMRRALSGISTPRQERDEVRIVSGVFEGYTTGTPLCVIINNENTQGRDYSEFKDSPRPSHADYVAGVKYLGYQDYRGGGHFSGRLTAPIVATGAILSHALEDKGIYIGTHISKIRSVYDAPFSKIEADVRKLSKSLFPTLDPSAEARMKDVIEAARKDGDSVGGILETAITGIPAGVGEPWFDSMESVLSHALFSIPAVKGVEFGAGFAISDMLGSEANDPFIINNGRVETRGNNNGGINGGITNGMPIILRCAVKPTPSIFKEQDTVSLGEMTERKMTVTGRHDPAIIHRARAVVDAMCAITVADMLCVKYGTDWLNGVKK